MQFIRNRYFLSATVFLIFISSCNAENIDHTSMESSENIYNYRQSSELVIDMSLKTMFHDQQVRKLADAAARGRVNTVKELVAKGVDVNHQGTNGATPLFWVLRNINIDGFGKLLDLGADPNILFADGSVMHWAARYKKDTEFLQVALSHGGDPNLSAGQLNETPIFKTIGIKGSGNVPALDLLLHAGADINAVTGGEKIFGISMGGITPVMMAADIVRYDLVYELLIRGADYSLRDDIGRNLMDRVITDSGLRFEAGSEQEGYLLKVKLFLSSQENHRTD